MPDVVFKKVDYTLKKLVEDIDIGEIGLPDIQRPFVWPSSKVRDLFDSMYRGYPIGYFLFWENGFPGEHKVIGTGQKQKAPRLLIVDGQQRLASLYTVTKAVPIVSKDFRHARIRIAFNPNRIKHPRITCLKLRPDLPTKNCKKCIRCMRCLKDGMKWNIRPS